MDLVDEQDIAGLEAGEDRDEIGASRKGWPGGGVDLGAQFGADDMGEGCFAQSWWAMEEDVFEMLAFVEVGRALLAGFDRFDGDQEAFDEFGLPDIFLDGLRAQCPVGVFFDGRSGRCDDAIGSHVQSVSGIGRVQRENGLNLDDSVYVCA